MKRLTQLLFSISLLLLLAACGAEGSSGKQSDANKAKIQAVYDAWSNGTKEEWIEAYHSILADDYVRWNGRYVGLGFQIDQENLTVIEAMRSPAKENFKPGDKFISVNGIEATVENVEDLPFQGAIGGEVNIVLERDGEELSMTLVRAAQEQTATKEQVLANQEGWEGYDNRPTIKTFRPLIAEDNVVYAAFELSGTNGEGAEVNWWNVERFVFNEDGELVGHGDLSEELFLWQQNGYYLTNE